MGTQFVRKSFFKFEKTTYRRYISEAKFEIYLRLKNFQCFYKKFNKVIATLTDKVEIFDIKVSILFCKCGQLLVFVSDL